LIFRAGKKGRCLKIKGAMFVEERHKKKTPWLIGAAILLFIFLVIAPNLGANSKDLPFIKGHWEGVIHRFSIRLCK
jgi:hypothetical protein